VAHAGREYDPWILATAISERYFTGSGRRVGPVRIGQVAKDLGIKIKEKQGVDIIFLSSIFKKNKNYLGINKFKLFLLIINKKNIPIGAFLNIIILN